MTSITQKQECERAPTGFLSRLAERLNGKRDILIPYFNFRRVLKGNMESYVLKEIFKLRYEVYCLERNYLEASDCQEEMEIDEYDDCSIHFAAYTLDNNIIGTVRLVQPHPGQEYPFESHCVPFPDFVAPARESVAEVSRLVVRKTHRRRRGDSMEGISQDFVEKGSARSIQPGSSVRRDKRSNSPLLLLGMYREMYRYSRQNGIRYWYAAMERSLARSLGKMGFKFVPIGPQVDYYGPVTPHMADLDELIERLKRENKFLAAWFNDEPIPFWIMVKTMAGNFVGGFRKK
ncbi:PEP-CTERM/exosortase system-associated acyltransferase [Telluria aromaticivorans]|uniref:PEP-CTERM/exosortase system-associated acyltransferase n=1 Tax=Telluria aromaticivorans TaxID=2725995 RepID=A0A7Y2K032_9BURK|nr:PEP-CTERM/exosortase system-associated acyltransferase [Telluria aromaticivorans]NNG24187.1 PEP-CTERM/exosortase system-associated acyltransferase [Telluria aromaticivorans]